jgi:hypothetical protein
LNPSEVEIKKAEIAGSPWKRKNFLSLLFPGFVFLRKLSPESKRRKSRNKSKRKENK